MIKSTTTVKAITIKEGMSPSVVIVVDFFKKPKGRRIKLLSNYNAKYTSSGAEGLIDYTWGNYYFKSTQWQGYQETDLNVVVDLGSTQKVNKIALTFL